MEKWKCRQIAKSRQIAKPSTSKMQNFLRMIPMQYQKESVQNSRKCSILNKSLQSKQTNK